MNDIDCAYFPEARFKKTLKAIEYLMSPKKQNNLCRLQEYDANPNLFANEKKMSIQIN